MQPEPTRLYNNTRRKEIHVKQVRKALEIDERGREINQVGIIATVIFVTD